MANCCFYQMEVSAKTKESIDRLMNILQYKDKEYLLYRVFDAQDCGSAEESGLWCTGINGYVAWACGGWIEEKDQPDVHPPEEPDTTAHLTNLQTVCHALDLGVEIFSEEPGCCFQEHIAVGHNGNVTINKSKQWNGVGTGFGRAYCAFGDPWEVYEGVKDDET